MHYKKGVIMSDLEMATYALLRMPYLLSYRLQILFSYTYEHLKKKMELRQLQDDQ